MKPNSIFTTGALLVAAGIGMAGFTGSAVAASGTSQFVKNVSMAFTGQAAQITIRNEADNKHLNFLNLQVQESKLTFDFSGSATCKKGNAIHGVGAYMYFGPVSLRGSSLNTFGTLYDQNKMNIAWHDGDKVVEAAYDSFEVPLNKIKQGHPALRVDAIDELEKKAQQHVQGGGDLVDFYRQDQHLVLQRPITLAALCRNQNNFNSSFGYETKLHTIQITYKGDPAINNKAQLNAALVGNQGKGFQAGEQSFKLASADFMGNLPHYNGKCVPTENPKIRINLTATGTKRGVVQLVVASYSNQYADYGDYHVANGYVYDPKDGAAHMDFYFPLKEMLSQDKYSYMAIHNNKNFNHNMQIKARWRTLPDGEWSQYQGFDNAVYRHSCKPQLNVPVGGGVGGKVGYDNQGGQGPKLDKMPAPSKPKRAKIEPTEPVDPKPKRDRVAPAPQPLKLKRATTD